MTKKDYELIASVLKQARNLCNDELSNYDDDILFLDTLSSRYANTLASKNPRFNRTKFLKACGVEIEHNHNTSYALKGCKACIGYSKEIKKEKCIICDDDFYNGHQCI